MCVLGIWLRIARTRPPYLRRTDRHRLGPPWHLRRSRRGQTDTGWGHLGTYGDQGEAEQRRIVQLYRLMAWGHG
jgi:hypothetical protein